MVGRERNGVKHLSEDELDRLQAEADDIKEHKRLTFLIRLYNGVTLAAAAEDIGISQVTASNWVTRWNEGGPGKLTPNFGGGSQVFGV
jgi:transposase